MSNKKLPEPTLKEFYQGYAEEVEKHMLQTPTHTLSYILAKVVLLLVMDRIGQLTAEERKKK